MLSLGAILGIIGAVFTAIFGALKWGQHSGAKDAEVKAKVDNANADAKRAVESNQKATEAQVEVATKSAEVNNEVSKLNDGDALNELRKSYSRD